MNQNACFYSGFAACSAEPANAGPKPDVLLYLAANSAILERYAGFRSQAVRSLGTVIRSICKQVINKCSAANLSLFFVLSLVFLVD